MELNVQNLGHRVRKKFELLPYSHFVEYNRSSINLCFSEGNNCVHASHKICKADVVNKKD